MSRLQLVAVGVAAFVGVATAGALTALAATEGGAKTATLGVTLKEMRILPAQPTVSRGQVTLVARNSGTVEHELVVIRTSNPLKIRNFKAVEPEANKAGEVEDVAPGTAKRVTLNLQPGKYLLICNIVGHYQLGMSAPLVVR
jgi:uncharacterized cupredoxin-like copper-binding protein